MASDAVATARIGVAASRGTRTCGIQITASRAAAKKTEIPQPKNPTAPVAAMAVTVARSFQLRADCAAAPQSRIHPSRNGSRR